MRGQFVSKPLIHFINAVEPNGRKTVCGLWSNKQRYDGDYPSTTGYPGEVTCWSCKRTRAWKAANG